MRICLRKSSTDARACWASRMDTNACNPIPKARTSTSARYPFNTPFGNIVYQDVEVKIDEKTLQDIANDYVLFP